MAQWEGKAKKPVLLDSYEKEGNLLVLQLNPPTTPPPPPRDGAAVASLLAPELQPQAWRPSSL